MNQEDKIVWIAVGKMCWQTGRVDIIGIYEEEITEKTIWDELYSNGKKGKFKGETVHQIQLIKVNRSQLIKI